VFGGRVASAGVDAQSVAAGLACLYDARIGVGECLGEGGELPVDARHARFGHFLPAGAVPSVRINAGRCA